MADRSVIQSFSREASFVPSTWDEKARTIEVVWSTGARVRRREFDFDKWRWVEFDEELSLAGVNLERLNNGAPFLAVHNGRSLDAILGVVVEGSARIEGNEGRATIRLSERDDLQKYVQDILAGIIRKISVGYDVRRWQVTQLEDGRELRTAIDWEAFELSAVPMGADDGAGTRSLPGWEALPPQLREVIMSENAKPGNGQPGATAPSTERGGGPGAVDPAAVDQAVQAELARRDTITSTARLLGIEDEAFVRSLVDGRVPLDGDKGARAQLLEGAAKRSDEAGINPSVRVQAGDRDEKLTRAHAMRDAILHRLKPGQVEVKDPMKPFMGRRLPDLARIALRDAGERDEGLTDFEVLQRALRVRSGGGLHSTGDFPLILGDVVNRSLQAGYKARPALWKRLARQTSARDFRQIFRLQLHGPITPEKPNEAGEYEHTTLEESREAFRVERRGRLIGFTLEAMINDDLAALDRVPEHMGWGAAMKEARLFWDLFVSGKMADGKAIWHADHKNLKTPGTALSRTDTTGLDDAVELLRNQTDATGEKIFLEPAFVVVPSALEREVTRLLADVVPSKADDVIPEHLRRLEPIVEPILDETSKKAYWVAASPMSVGGMEYAYLEGYEGVLVDQEPDFKRDGVEWRMRHFYGVGCTDWRFAVKNAGG